MAPRKKGSQCGRRSSGPCSDERSSPCRKQLDDAYEARKKEIQPLPCGHSSPRARALVRTWALETARAAMRPGDGAAPIIYSLDADLPPRIVSPSPAVHAILWLDRMDVTPPAHRPPR
jgi:hypothetical protein